MSNESAVSRVSTPNKRVGFRARTAALILTGGLALTGCMEGERGHLEPIQAPTPIETTATTTTVKPEAKKDLMIWDTEKYFADSLRNRKIQTEVTKAGERIAEVSKTGEIGVFDFYNIDTDEWKSRNRNTTGWGWLQHNPQYDNKNYQIATLVFMQNGTVDTTKGIHGLSMRVGDGSRISFDAPELPSHFKSPIRAGWDTQVIQGQEIRSTLNLVNSINPVTTVEVEVLDVEALRTLDNYMRDLHLAE